ncbi:MAG: hypothetical protein HWE07_09205 [Cytophagia bacterium]|nr:hypothetical protein [Cytophagia bacterium]
MRKLFTLLSLFLVAITATPQEPVVIDDVGYDYVVDVGSGSVEHAIYVVAPVVDFEFIDIANPVGSTISRSENQWLAVDYRLKIDLQCNSPGVVEGPVPINLQTFINRSDFTSNGSHREQIFSEQTNGDYSPDYLPDLKVPWQDHPYSLKS